MSAGKPGHYYTFHVSDGTNPDFPGVTVRNVAAEHTLWVNVGRSRIAASVFTTKAVADLYAEPDRIACIPITFREGDGLDGKARDDSGGSGC